MTTIRCSKHAAVARALGSAALLAAVAGAGCAPTLHARGSVQTRAEVGEATGQSDAYDAEPIEGAKVVLVGCPDDGTGPGKGRLLGETDEEGRFERRGPAVAASCTVHVEKEGYHARRYEVRELCVEFSAGESRCHRLLVQAELAPRDDEPSGE